MGIGGLCLCLMGMMRSHGGPYHHYQHGDGRAGLVFGVGIVGMGLTVMSSTVFAAARRATGLTFRRKLLWPPVDVKTGERWVKWYESRLAKIHETAESRIAFAIERYGNEIEDPAIREVWERQLREDVMEKVDRIKERQKCCNDMLLQAKERELNPDRDDRRRRHSPILALYLYVGERCLDWLISWMRDNPHFCYEPSEPNNVPGSGSLEWLMGGYENGPDSAPAIPKAATSSEPVIQYTASPATNLSTPTPFIAVAQSQQQQHSPPSPELMPEPSAPALSESQFLKMVPPPPTALLLDNQGIQPSDQRSSASSVTSTNPIVDSSDQPQRYETLEPPPYTPVDNSDPGADSEAEQEPKAKKRTIVAYTEND
ncbi:hypothetical protein GGH94_005963 [Coemansia aciculifera]|uniref:Uncharacterized protein n=1 Tax=Coemansia aciculifera TaxID=417176 RepID=A0A9W8M3C4_9FUNG|nr:hypothetical protein GGH94_005963 [Coemansia aciculifera]